MDAQKETFADKLKKEGEELRNKTREAITEVFEAAKKTNHGYFVLSLAPEFRGMSGPGWNTAQECFVAIQDYADYLNTAPNSRIRIRVALSFYTHISEASGFYESLKNMLRVAEFGRAVSKAVDFFNILGEVHHTYMESYSPPQTFKAIHGGREVTFTVTAEPGKSFKIQWV